MGSPIEKRLRVVDERGGALVPSARVRQCGAADGAAAGASTGRGASGAAAGAGVDDGADSLA
jgi:hypothetical protein